MVDIAAPVGKMIKMNGDPLSVLNSINGENSPSQSAHMSRVSQEEINSARKNTQSVEQKHEKARMPSEKSGVGILTLPKKDSLAEIMSQEKAA